MSSLPVSTGSGNSGSTVSDEQRHREMLDKGLGFFQIFAFTEEVRERTGGAPATAVAAVPWGPKSCRGCSAVGGLAV